MDKCSDAKFAAFRKRKASKRVPREVGTTSGAEADDDGEMPSVAPGAEPLISKALKKASTAREPIGVPEEAEADRAKAAEMVQSTGAVPKLEIAKVMGGNEGA